MNPELLQRLLIKANKLGAQGYEVLKWEPPESGSNDPDGTLYYTVPENKSMTDKPWYLD